VSQSLPARRPKDRATTYEVALDPDEVTELFVEDDAIVERPLTWRPRAVDPRSGARFILMRASSGFVLAVNRDEARSGFWPPDGPLAQVQVTGTNRGSRVQIRFRPHPRTRAFWTNAMTSILGTAALLWAFGGAALAAVALVPALVACGAVARAFRRGQRDREEVRRLVESYLGPRQVRASAAPFRSAVLSDKDA
jgi:hypothetical protein